MQTNYLKVFFLLLVAGLAACTPGKKENDRQSVSQEPFGTLSDGTAVTQYTLTNAGGIEMKVIDYGGIITSLKVPDKDGNFEDIVLGYDNLDGYVASSPYFGAIIGRYGNRIANGTFILDSVEYSLAKNDNSNHLHGGEKGFDKVVWDASVVDNEEGVGLVLTYTSPDGEEGYPGKLDVTVTYLLANDSTLTFDYKANTDKRTVVNLTQHSYFNLAAMKENILGHVVQINASHFLPVDSTLIPTTELKPVEGTPFDFTEPKEVGLEIGVEDQQIQYGLGYDHCWVLDKEGDELSFAASVYEPESGRFMEIFTTEPGVQFYTGNFLDGSITGKDGKVYNQRSGLCLETQHFPNSPNEPDFPSVILNPGEEYHTVTKTKFSTR